MLTSCKEDKEVQSEEVAKGAPALDFTTAQYKQSTTLACKDTCTYADIEVPIAQNTPVVADSINKKIFSVVRNIVYFGEKPSNAKNYDGIVKSFIKSYDDLAKEFPEEANMQWVARIRGSITYQSGNLLNIKLNNYMFTGGAHGYEGDRSLIFDLKTGKSLGPAELFTDVKSVTALAEKKFREKYNIAAGKNINATGLMFENDKFVLPQNIFLQDNGVLLYYNAYEAASYADGSKELLLPYSVIDDYLRVK